MKKCCFVLLMLLYLKSYAQYNLSFVNPDIKGSKFRVTLQMSAYTPFSLGPNNLRFNYPVENLSNPVIVNDNFPSSAFGETTLLGSNSSTGVVSVNTAYHGNMHARQLPISKEGVELVTIEFDIIKPAEKIELTWRFDKHPKTAVVDDDKNTVSISEAKPLKTTLIKNTGLPVNKE